MRRPEPLLLPAAMSAILLLPLPAAMSPALLVPAACPALPAALYALAVPLPGALLPAVSLHTGTQFYHTTRQPDLPGDAHASALLLPAAVSGVSAAHAAAPAAGV